MNEGKGATVDPALWAGGGEDKHRVSWENLDPQGKRCQMAQKRGVNLGEKRRWRNEEGSPN